MDKKYKVSDDYMLRGIAGEYVLIPVGETSDQMNGMFMVNETFQYLWELLSEPKTVEEVINSAKEDFDDPTGELEKDIISFMNESLAIGALLEVE